MAKTIYKYPLEPKSFQKIDIPEGYKILKVKEVNRQVFLWALVDTEAKKVKLPISIFVTGEEIPPEMLIIHIETIVFSSGLVYHIFINAAILKRD